MTAKEALYTYHRATLEMRQYEEKFMRNFREENAIDRRDVEENEELNQVYAKLQDAVMTKRAAQDVLKAEYTVRPESSDDIPDQKTMRSEEKEVLEYFRDENTSYSGELQRLF